MYDLLQDGTQAGRSNATPQPGKKGANWLPRLRDRAAGKRGAKRDQRDLTPNLVS